MGFYVRFFMSVNRQGGAQRDAHAQERLLARALVPPVELRAFPRTN